MRGLLDREAERRGHPEAEALANWKWIMKQIELPGLTTYTVNSMVIYKVSFHELEALCQRYGADQ
jgi:hypothetical protein